MGWGFFFLKILKSVLISKTSTVINITFMRCVKTIIQFTVSLHFLEWGLCKKLHQKTSTDFAKCFNNDNSIKFMRCVKTITAAFYEFWIYASMIWNQKTTFTVYRGMQIHFLRIHTPTIWNSKIIYRRKQTYLFMKLFIFWHFKFFWNFLAGNQRWFLYKKLNSHRLILCRFGHRGMEKLKSHPP